MITQLLAYVPFRDPLYGSWNWWYLLFLPLCIGISVTWKAMRCEDLSHFPRQVLRAVGLMLGGFLACALVLWGLMAWLYN